MPNTIEAMAPNTPAKNLALVGLELYSAKLFRAITKLRNLFVQIQLRSLQYSMYHPAAAPAPKIKITVRALRIAATCTGTQNITLRAIIQFVEVV